MQNNNFYSPFDNLCYSTCPNGYYSDINDELCINCDPSCLTCSGPSFTEC